MRTITATEASRGFSELLDAVELGETVVITRGNRALAQIAPAPSRTGRDLRAALSAVTRLDDDLESDISSATSLLTEEDDPWAGA
jgi:prevent-host-death family protein